MTWWNRKPKQESNPIDIVALESLRYQGSASDIVKGWVPILEEQTKELNALVEKLEVPKPDPSPDLSTKPEDIVGYCFGYVCPKKHVNSTFESISVEGYKEQRACQTCGGISKPAVVRRTAEAQWGNRAQPEPFNLNPEPKWGWYNSYTHYFGKTLNWGESIWTKYEFVHYLDTPKRKKK